MQVNTYAEPTGHPEKQGDVQSRSVLYEKTVIDIIPEGVYEAVLVDVRGFANAFGERVGLVFKIDSGPHRGMELMEAAALKDSPRGKLSELLRGMGGADGSILSAQTLLGRPCRIAVRHEQAKAGKTYAAITQTFQ